MEVGRFSAIGAGELWMGTEDPLIAKNIHTTIIKYVNWSLNKILSFYRFLYRKTQCDVGNSAAS